MNTEFNSMIKGLDTTSSCLKKKSIFFFFFEREQVIHCIKKKAYNRKDKRGADPKGPNLQAQEQQT